MLQQVHLEDRFLYVHRFYNEMLGTNRLEFVFFFRISPTCLTAKQSSSIHRADFLSLLQPFFIPADLASKRIDCLIKGNIHFLER